MTDVAFKGGIRRRPLFQYRVKNSSDYRYVAADNLHDASRLLEELGIQPDHMQLQGELIEKDSK